jgi:hypothetical protein
MGGNTICRNANHGNNLLLSVIINDFDFGRALFSPGEANTILVIDADTVLAFPVF